MGRARASRSWSRRRPGTGKTTVCRALVATRPGDRASRSRTRRARRAPASTTGVDYHFVDRARVPASSSAQGAFLEYAEYAGNLYGTSCAALDGAARRGPRPAARDRGAGRAPGARAPPRRAPRLPAAALARGRCERGSPGRGSDSAEAMRARLELARRELEDEGPLRLRRRERRPRALRRGGARDHRAERRRRR